MKVKRRIVDDRSRNGSNAGKSPERAIVALLKAVRETAGEPNHSNGYIESVPESNSIKSALLNGIMSSASKHEKIDENLMYFKRRQVLSRKGDLWINSSYFDINYVHQVNYLLVQYLISHFTLYELYVLFFQYQNVFGFDVVREAKRVAIESIDSETDLLTPEQVKRLKKMVWDMNKIWFGLILNFVMVSNLFWDEKTENIIRPELKLSK